jgi:hypothetical protein
VPGPSAWRSMDAAMRGRLRERVGGRKRLRDGGYVDQGALEAEGWPGVEIRAVGGEGAVGPGGSQCGSWGLCRAELQPLSFP